MPKSGISRFDLHLKKELTVTTDEVWPVDGTETVDRCPWCGSRSRTKKYQGLKDIVFGSAPGTWQSWKCNDCGSGYLDPRPSPGTIHKAYEKYYTHNKPNEHDKQRAFYNATSKLRLALVNGYRNKTFNSKFRPSLSIGYIITKLRPDTIKVINDDLRYIPPMADGETPKILDIGCGNGGYLNVVTQGGWHAVGCDPDPKSIELARGAGIEVLKGGSERWMNEAGTFDIITISHVIEHLHDPLDELSRIFQLLKPGGFLYLEVPTLNLLGISFGANIGLA